MAVLAIIIVVVVLIIAAAIAVGITIIKNAKYKELETEVLKKLNFSNWNIVPYFDELVTVKSRQALL